MAAFLIVDEGGEKRYEVVGRAVVGRDADCDILVSDLSASRKHAVLEETVAGWIVRDLSSVNGTFLKGARIVDATLTGGEDLRFGDVKAVFRIEENSSEASGTGKLLQTLSIKPVRKARPVAVVVATLAGIALLVAATLWSKGCLTHGPALIVSAPR